MKRPPRSLRSLLPMGACQYPTDMRGVLIALVVALAAVAGSVLAQGAAQPCSACGVIQSIAPVAERQQWQSLGTVAPGSLGIDGLSGMSGTSTQMAFGPGFSNRGLVVLGSAGGAAYAQKPSEYRRQRWDVTVKMDSGPVRVVSLKSEPLFLQEGDRVNVSGNSLELVNP